MNTIKPSKIKNIPKKINKYEDVINVENLGNYIDEIEVLNEIYRNANIEQKERIVKVIERGKIANKIKNS